MDADLKGELSQIEKSYKAFEHNGKPMSKIEVKKVLEFGINKGYETTADFNDGEVDNILMNIKT